MHYYLTKFHFDTTKGSKELMQVATSNVFYDGATDFEVSVFYRKHQSKYLDSKILFFLQLIKFNYYTLRVIIWQKNSSLMEVTLKRSYDIHCKSVNYHPSLFFNTNSKILRFYEDLIMV